MAPSTWALPGLLPSDLFSPAQVEAGKPHLHVEHPEIVLLESLVVRVIYGRVYWGSRIDL